MPNETSSFSIELRLVGRSLDSDCIGLLYLWHIWNNVQHRVINCRTIWAFSILFGAFSVLFERAILVIIELRNEAEVQESDDTANSNLLSNYSDWYQLLVVVYPKCESCIIWSNSSLTFITIIWSLILGLNIHPIRIPDGRVWLSKYLKLKVAFGAKMCLYTKQRPSENFGWKFTFLCKFSNVPQLIR